jgi:hypothetical protein
MEDNIAIVIRRRKITRSTESMILGYCLKILLGIIAVIAFLTMIQCTVKKPEAPTWSTNLTLPLINKTYLMPEIIRKIDQPGLSLDSNGDVIFSFRKELDTLRVSENLNSSDIHQVAAENLGEININPGNPTPITVNLSDYASLILDEVPPGSFDIQRDYPPIDKFNWATISSGSLAIVINNDFGVDLDTVIVQLVDLVYSRTLATEFIPPPGIPNGGSDTVLADLSGQTVSNTLRLYIHCHTPGGTMLSLADKSLTAGLDCGAGLTVSAAQAEIPRIVKDFFQAVPLSESNTILSAELASGNLNLQIRNNTGLTSLIQIDVPDFLLDGAPYSTTCTIAPYSTQNISRDLAGYLFEPYDQIRPQQISIEVSAVIDSSAPAMVSVDQNDSILVSADITNLTFASLTGVIDSTEATYNGLNLNIDLPKGFDSLQLVNASLILEIENSINFPGILNIGVNGNSGQILNLSGAIQAGGPDFPVVSYIVDSNLASFLNPVPTAITVNGTALFGDGHTVGTVTQDDYIVSRLEISSPLEAIIGQTAFRGDIDSRDIDQNNIDLITEHILQAQFLSSIVNHLPLGVSVEIYLSGDSATVFTNPELVLGPIEVRPGVTGAGNIVVTPTESQNIIALDSLDIKILEHPILYSGQLITLAGSDGRTVKISGADYVTAGGVLQIEYRFDGEK